MLDAYLRNWIDPPINHMGKQIASWGVRANYVTLLGFVAGLAAMVFVARDHLLLAMIFLGLNRVCDGLDGAVARTQGLSDFGGFLDILCDFIIYSGIVFAFCLLDSNNSLAAAFLIFSFIGPITSFLAYAIIAEKRQKKSDKRGKKSFYYLGGICEGTETAVLLFLMCLFPTYFAALCLTFGVLCWLTTLGRAYCAYVDFE